MSDTVSQPVPPGPKEASWAKPVISIVAMGIFLVAMLIAYSLKESGALNIMLGTAAAMGLSVVNYWLGSSSGSDRKTEMLNKPPPAS